jgi:uncharacterized protein with HEPN domain
MEKDNTLYLRNIIDKAEEAVAFCQGAALPDFLQNNMLQSAVVMKLIVIGEEARKLPPEITDAIPLPWRMITGFRNMAVHEYFNLDLSQVWVTAQEDLPELIEKCRAFLEKVETP